MQLYQCTGKLNSDLLARCIENDSWKCFAYLYSLNTQVDLAHLRELAADKRREGLFDRLIQTVWQGLTQMMAAVDSHTDEGDKGGTLIITDSRMLSHAGFTHYANVQKRVL
jgi:hypothetical protein